VLTALQVVALYVLPMLLIVTDAVPAAYRYWLFGIGMAIPLLEMIVGRWLPRRIGLRVDTLMPYFLPYLAFTTVLTVGLLLLAQLLGKVPAGHSLDWWNPSLILTITVLSFLQEVCFRGYLLEKLAIVFDQVSLRVLVNALLFAWMHVIYPDPLFSMAITFVAGLGFAAMYVAYPNMWLVAGSHAVLNCVGTLYCFLNLAASCAG